MPSEHVYFDEAEHRHLKTKREQDGYDSFSAVVRELVREDMAAEEAVADA